MIAFENYEDNSGGDLDMQICESSKHLERFFDRMLDKELNS